MQKKNVKVCILLLVAILLLFCVDLIIKTAGIGEINANFYFGIWHGASALLLFMFILAILLLFFAKNNSISLLGKMFVIMGIAVNIIERLSFGGVVDYIPFFNLTLFNLADTSIVFGFGMIFFILIKSPHKSKTPS